MGFSLSQNCVLSFVACLQYVPLTTASQKEDQRQQVASEGLHRILNAAPAAHRGHGTDLRWGLARGLA